MNPTAIAYALQLMTAIPGLIQAGIDVSRTVTDARDKLAQMDAEGRNPSDAEWAELNQEIARLRGELHAT